MTGLRSGEVVGAVLLTTEPTAEYDRPTEAELLHLAIVRILTAAKKILHPELFREFLERWEAAHNDPAVLDELPEVQPLTWPAQAVLLRAARTSPRPEASHSSDRQPWSS